ncbi:MAG: hypothetical protein U1F11_15245 [Steroidobacteraceae bacterium]
MPEPRPAPRPRGCLTTLFGALTLLLLAGVAAWAWDAIVEAPWAHSLRQPFAENAGDTDGRSLLTGPWVGTVVSAGGTVRGELRLRIERRSFGAQGRTSGVGGPSYPDFKGEARVCGLGADEGAASAPRDLWGYASRDGSVVHVQFPFSQAAPWNLDGIAGAWRREAGELVLEMRVVRNHSVAWGGAEKEALGRKVRVVLRRAAAGAFERGC